MYPYPVPPRRENFFVTLVKTWAKASVISVTVAIVLFATCFTLLVALVAMIGGAVAGGVPGTISVGEATASFAAGREGSENIVLSVPVAGLILGQGDGAGGGFFGGEVTYGYDVKAALEDAAEIDDVKGVVLDITSGGGTIYGSVAISDGVDRYREETDRPIISFVEGVAASGAYWAAASTDEILVDHGSSVGSIGVIYGPFQFFDRPVAFDGGLLGGGIVTQNGISVTYFTAGRGKDMGNPFRPLTDEEISIAQTG
ncbi:MAG: S49 family peptidase, partial [Acidimicrobiia bacterium]|nr:S49 family peptidase [Acidimicrobiia bacterium]